MTELATIIGSDRDMPAILDDVVHLAQRRIPGAADVSITLLRDEKASTVAATGPLAVALDEVQYEQGYGPCLDAGRTDEPLHIRDVAIETRWPRYIATARELGLGSSLSMPLPIENYLVGALNQYSSTRDAFDENSLRLGRAFASHITAALSMAEARASHRERAAHFERAMTSHSVIDQAKGIIMAEHKCTGETAFAMLRKLSMDENIKLYDLAESLVVSASGHPLR
jgi:GAF domain-containing protein